MTLEQINNRFHQSKIATITGEDEALGIEGEKGIAPITVDLDWVIRFHESYNVDHERNAVGVVFTNGDVEYILTDYKTFKKAFFNYHLHRKEK